MTKSTQSAAKPGDSTRAEFDPLVRDFRRRMRCIGRMLREVFGLNHQDNPALMCRDGYLVAVSRIVEVLAKDDGQLSTSELAALSKALAEHRRLDLAEKDGKRVPMNGESDPDGLTANESAQLPRRFGNMVDQIYGTNLSKSDESNGDMNGNANHDELQT